MYVRLVCTYLKFSLFQGFYRVSWGLYILEITCVIAFSNMYSMGIGEIGGGPLQYSPKSKVWACGQSMRRKTSLSALRTSFYSHFAKINDWTFSPHFFHCVSCYQIEEVVLIHMKYRARTHNYLDFLMNLLRN